MGLTDVDLGYNLNAICPHCSHEHLDSWEYYMNDGDEGVQFCAHCEKQFKVVCDITTTYSTYKLGRSS